MLCRMDMACEFKMDQEQGEIIGLGSTFGNIDLAGDVIEKGAFQRSVAEFGSGERFVAMLDHHKMDAPVGRWVRIAESERGLEVTGKLSMRVGRAQELAALAADGALGGLSIGFVTKDSRIDPDRNIRYITEIDLREISLVSIPANPKAKIEAVKMDVADEISTERDFERALVLHLGYSRRQAKAITAAGFKSSVRDERDEIDADALRDAVEGFKRLAQMRL